MLNNYRSNKKLINSNDLSPWLNNNHEYSFDTYYDSPDIIPKPDKKANQYIIKNKTIVRKQTQENREEKNSIKITDYILPPLLTRRSNVKIKEQIRDYSTLDAGPINFYSQKKKNRERYSRQHEYPNIQSQSMSPQKHRYEKMIAKNYKQNPTQRQLELNGHKYNMKSSIDQYSDRKRLKEKNEGFDYFSKGTIPVHELMTENSKSKVLRKVLSQIKRKSFQLQS